MACVNVSKKISSKTTVL